MRMFAPMPGTTKPGINIPNILKALAVCSVTSYAWGIIVRLLSVPSAVALFGGLIIGITASQICFARWAFFRVPMTAREIHEQQEATKRLNEIFGQAKYNLRKP